MDVKEMNSTSKILITGANGFTGKHACSHFRKRGYEVVAVVRKSQPINDAHTIEACDLTNKKEVFQLIHKIKPNYVLHLAGQNHVESSWIDPVATIEANMLSTLYLLEAVREVNHSSKTIVVGSALQFNPKTTTYPPHPYSLSKTFQAQIANYWANFFNMDIVIAKPTNLIGPGHSNGVCSIFGKRIVEMERGRGNKHIEINNGSTKRDFLDVRDAVYAYETLLRRGDPGKIYEVLSGVKHSLYEVIETYKTLSKVPFLIKNNTLENKSEPSSLSDSNTYPPGWKPTISFQESLDDILNFYRKT